MKGSGNSSHKVKGNNHEQLVATSKRRPWVGNNQKQAMPQTSNDNLE
jgi:hypothetical protein